MSKESIRGFIDKWRGKGNEDQDSQKFWIGLFQKVLGVEYPDDVIDFEKKVEINRATKKIDAYVPEVKALIEQKSYGRSLTKKYRQSDGALLTPIEQAQRYGRHLDYNEFPRWYITSNFGEIRVYDNTKLGSAPEIIKLEDLERDYTRLGFLLDQKDDHIEKEKELTLQAGRLVGRLYSALLKEYNDPSDPKTLESLNVLMVRLVLLLYMEDAGVFEPHKFLRYMERFRDNPNSFRLELQTLFNVLDTLSEDRDPYLDPELLSFPYVDGKVFADRGIQIPRFNDEIISILLDEASAGFNWSGISPTIFGSVFEATLNPETKHQTGSHFTAIESIHKVIDPLFLNDLKAELKEIKSKENLRGARTRALKAFIKKLASIKILDPAAGSGNFLTMSFIELRRLENEALDAIYNGQVRIAGEAEISVKIDNFFGIEINGFACAVANAALLIAENQMMQETVTLLGQNFEFLPLV